MGLWLQSMMTVESSTSLMTDLNLTELGTTNHTRIAMDVAPCYAADFCNPTPSRNHRTKTILKGGQYIWLQPRITNGLSHTWKDEHGRWLGCDIAAGKNVLTLISAYCICKDSINPTSYSIAAPERRSLQTAQHPHALHPRKAFLKDITNFITYLKIKGHNIILCMDANTPWNHADIMTLKQDTGLTDLMQAANPDNSPPSNR